MDLELCYNMHFKMCWGLGIAEHAFDPSTLEAEGSLVYTVSSRTAELHSETPRLKIKIKQMKKQFYLICYSLVQMLLIIGDILLFVFSLLPINSPYHKNPHNLLFSVCSLGWHWICDSSTSASRVLQRQANPTMASSTPHCFPT